MDSADGKIGEKGCIFTALWEMKQPHTMTGPCFSGCVLEYGFLSPQHGEKRGCFFHFSVDWLYGWRILLVIPLEF
ncbi:hypothetical protein [uncultured Bilophila sp.]|uniref:hypothetical protein n=1 Tax=uncultured Bilophila sp. TaxID=529385 RepID=UPI00266FF3BF|nr:hypothetical protein [uncultured Bilophila sp.]